MRTIIAGSRKIPEKQALNAIYYCPWWEEITKVLSGTCQGPDIAGEKFAAREMIEAEHYSPDWGKYPGCAGPIRNQHMVNEADAAIIIWDGKSKGTRDLITKAKRKKLKMWIYYTNPEWWEKNEIREIPGKTREVI